MAKNTPKTGQPERGPDDVVRMNVNMRRGDRARFRYFCESHGTDMETLAAAWVLDRLADEERKLAKAK